MNAPSSPESGLEWGFGLRIRTALVLPGAVPARDDGGPADIEIVVGTSPHWNGGRAWEVYRVASADLFEIAVPGVARFTCVDRRRIVVDPAPGADRADVAAMIVATVLPALLWARGAIVLHASAFVLPGAAHAVAIVGASGSGKSTALAHALSIGARQVADDSIDVRLDGGGVVVTGLAGGRYERGGDDRAFRATGRAQRHGGGRLGMIAVLTPDAGEPRRITGSEAVAALLRHRHRPTIATLLGLEPALLPVTATIARQIPIVAIPIDRMALHRR